MLASLQMHFSVKNIFLYVVSSVWSKLKDTTTPEKAAFCCHTAALLDSSSLKFKVECSQTYLVLATRDLIYDILKPSRARFQPKNTPSRFSKGQKNYSSCILRLQLLWKNTHTLTNTHSPLWSDGNSPGEHAKWCGGGRFEKGLNEFISITIWSGLNVRPGCLFDV